MPVVGVTHAQAVFREAEARHCLPRRRIVVSGPPQPPYGGWYVQKAFSDGPLTENGSHDFDFARSCTIIVL